MFKVLVGLFCLLISTSVMAKDQQYRIVMELSPPHQNIVDGKIVGSIPRMIEKNCQRINLLCHLEMYPWNRAFEIAKNDNQTLIANIARTPERENMFHWVGIVHKYEFGLLALSHRSDIILEELEDALHFTIAVQRGDFAYEYLIQHGFSVDQNIFLTADITESWRLLQRGKVDFIIEDPDNVVPMTSKLNMSSESVTILYPIDDLSVLTWLAANKEVNKSVVKELQDLTWLE